MDRSIKYVRFKENGMIRPCIGYDPLFEGLGAYGVKHTEEEIASGLCPVEWYSDKIVEPEKLSSQIDFAIASICADFHLPADTMCVVSVTQENPHLWHIYLTWKGPLLLDFGNSCVVLVQRYAGKLERANIGTFRSESQDEPACEVCQKMNIPFIRVEVTSDEDTHHWLNACSENCLQQIILRWPQICEVIHPE